MEALYIKLKIAYRKYIGKSKIRVGYSPGGPTGGAPFDIRVFTMRVYTNTGTVCTVFTMRYVVYANEPL